MGMADEATYVDENTVTDTYHVPGTALPDPEGAEATEEQQEDLQAEEAERLEAREVAAATLDVRTPELAYATKNNIVHPGPVGAAIAAQAEAVYVSEDVFGTSQPLRVDVDPTLLVPQFEEPDVDLEEAREQFDAEVEQLVEARRADVEEPEDESDNE